MRDLLVSALFFVLAYADKHCNDRSWVSEATGYSCEDLINFVHCPENLSEIADSLGIDIPWNLSDKITPASTLAEICPGTCELCGKVDNRKDLQKILQGEVCGDNALVVEASGFACDQLMQFLECSTDLRALAEEWGIPIPEEYSAFIPPKTALGDICAATCDHCKGLPVINTAALDAEKCHAAPGYCLLCNGCLTGSGCPDYCFTKCSPFSNCPNVIGLVEETCESIPPECGTCLPKCLENPSDYVFGECDPGCKDCVNWSHCYNTYSSDVKLESTGEVVFNFGASRTSDPALTVESNFIGGTAGGISIQSIDSDLPVSYLHPGDHPCGDFPLLEEIAGVDCEAFVDFLSCSKDLRQVLAEFGFEVPVEFQAILPMGLRIGDMCPASCNICKHQPIDGVNMTEEECFSTPMRCMDCQGCMGGGECPDYCLFGCATHFKCPKILAAYLEPKPCRSVPLKCLRCAKCVADSSPCPTYCIPECAAFRHCGGNDDDGPGPPPGIAADSGGRPPKFSPHWRG